MRGIVLVLLFVTIISVPLIGRAQVSNQELTQQLQLQIERLQRLQELLSQLLARQNLSTSTHTQTEVAPTINSINHISGKKVATIFGTRLQNTKVYFNGSVVSKENYTYWTDHQISFILPTYESGVYPIYVSANGVKSNTLNLSIGKAGGSETAAPTIYSASYISGKMVVTVRGNNLQNAKIYFDNNLINKEDYS